MIGSSQFTIGNRGNNTRRCRADGRPERSREAPTRHCGPGQRIRRRTLDNLRLSCFVGPAGTTFAPTADRSCSGERSSPPVANHDRQTGRAPSRPHSSGYRPHRCRNVGETGPRALVGAGIVALSNTATRQGDCPRNRPRAAYDAVEAPRERRDRRLAGYNPRPGTVVVGRCGKSRAQQVQEPPGTRVKPRFPVDFTSPQPPIVRKS